ncbi:hypothetical protein [Nocardia blacklockiae]|uniref:hypothetical protein n=1 Tax=Nocardia blacklockiae TaxID=480036 RepID=UPI0018942C55|nr:hypothetical protein [Nocardia blacklockiae]MBF6173482.1 hypothetical protein [Nocardia blacklockiae]
MQQFGFRARMVGGPSMNHPYGHPEYPPYGHPPPAYPAYGYPPPGYPPKAGGGTAITGGILALLQGLLLGYVAVAFAASAEDIGSAVAVGSVVGGTGTIGGCYAVGAILLFCRRRAGRVLVILAATLALLGVTGLAVGSALLGGMEESDVVPVLVFVGIVFVIELLTLCLAVASSTGRWIAARRSGGYSVPPPYPYY